MVHRSDHDSSSDEDRFRDEFNASPIVMAIFRRSGSDFILEEVNEATHRIVHDAAETFLGKPAAEIYHERPDQVELMERSWASQQRLTNPRPLRVVSDGREIVLQVAVAPLSEHRMILYATEITAQVAAEEQLAAAVRRNEILFEQAANGMIRLDDLGLIVETNRAGAALLGLPGPDLIGMRFAEMAERVPDSETTTGQNKPDVTEWMISRTDGSMRIVELSEVVLDDGGKLLSLHDLTPHYEQQSRLRRRERQTHRMIELCPDGIVVITGETVVYANIEFLRLVGATRRSEVVGRHMLSFVHPDALPSVASRIERLRKEGTLARAPQAERLVRLDGTWIHVEVAGMTFEYEDQPSMMFAMRDVSERERQQEALRRSEARYRGLFDTSSELIYRVSPDGRVLEVNAAAVRVASWTVEEMVGRSFRDFIHADDREAALEAFQRTMTEGSASAILRVHRRDGTYAFLDTVNNAEMLDGKVVAVFGMARDITDRLAAAEQVRERERLLSAVLDGLPVGVVVADAEGRIVRSNPEADLIWGFHRTSTALAAPRVYRGWWVDSGLPIGDEDWASTRALRDGAVSLNELIEIERPDGTHRVILNSAAPLRDGQGEINGAVILNQDVTEVRRNELDQKAADARLREIIASTSDGICTVDDQGRATLVSPAATAMLGVPQDELLGKNLHAALHAGETGRDVFAEVMSTGQPQPLYEDVFVRRDGIRLEVEVSCAPILVDLGARGAVITFRDVTRRNQLERELEKAQRFAIIGQLATTVSHEFNNVLMGINPFAEIIQRGSSGGDVRLRIAAEHIQQAIRRGKQITREILKFAQAAEPNMIPVCLGNLLESSLPELEAIAGSDVAITVPTVEPELAVCVDPVQVHQALSNLVANARDAMNGRGAITIDAAPADPVEMQDGEQEWVRLSVSDQGPGIEPQHLDRIFQPLFTTKQAGGTGLGLAVVQQVVTSHGGRLEVDSTVGVGTTFKLFFPRCSRPEEQTVSAQARPASSVRTIVLVEDDLTVAAGLESLLQLEGITTHAVTLGANAEAAVERYAPDAVVIDRGLPDMDGLDVARTLLARWPALPLVFSTGHGAQDEVSEVPAGARVASLLKPYALTDLLDLLERLVR